MSQLPSASRRLPPADYTAWRLDEALADLQSRGLAAHVVETAPPPRPARLAQRDKSRLEEGASPARSGREPHLGAWRVLRSGLSEANTAEQTVELLVAREQLAPPEAPGQNCAGETALSPNSSPP